MTRREDDKPTLEDLLIDMSDDAEFEWDTGEVAVDDDGEQVDVLRFRIHGELYAVEAAFVREIMGEVPLTPLPGAPDYIRGLAVLRRQVVGILDLQVFLEAKIGEAPVGHTEQDGSARLLVIETEGYTVGLQVDAVLGLDSWPLSAMTRSDMPANLARRQRQFAKGVRHMQAEVVLLLNIEKLLEEAAVR